jgi:hypothetical protein
MWTTRLSRCEKGLELGWREEIRFWSPWAWQQAGRWHLSIWDRSLEIAEKPPCDAEPLRGTARPPVCGFLASPRKRRLGPNRTGVFLGVNKRNKLQQDEFFSPCLESEGFAQAHIGPQLGV